MALQGVLFWETTCSTCMSLSMFKVNLPCVTPKHSLTYSDTAQNISHTTVPETQTRLSLYFFPLSPYLLNHRILQFPLWFALHPLRPGV